VCDEGVSRCAELKCGLRSVPGSSHCVSVQLPMSAAAKNIKNVKIQWRVCFGVEKPLSPNLAGMRIVEYYFTADNIVPCHLYVASRGTFSIRLLDDVKVLRIDNFDGRTRDFEFVKVDPASDSMHFLAPKPTEPTDAHMTKVDWFPLTHYNDTAFVCFDVVGNEAESVRGVLSDAAVVSGVRKIQELRRTGGTELSRAGGEHGDVSAYPHLVVEFFEGRLLAEAHAADVGEQPYQDDRIAGRHCQVHRRRRPVDLRDSLSLQ